MMFKELRFSDDDQLLAAAAVIDSTVPRIIREAILSTTEPIKMIIDEISNGRARNLPEEAWSRANALLLKMIGAQEDTKVGGEHIRFLGYVKEYFSLMHAAQRLPVTPGPVFMENLSHLADTFFDIGALEASCPQIPPKALVHHKFGWNPSALKNALLL